VWPFVLALIIALAVVTYLPGLSLWLPNLVMAAK
jgi:TRAP-type C4-dicarboxylate transport system permease large subunit